MRIDYRKCWEDLKSEVIDLILNEMTKEVGIEINEIIKKIEKSQQVDMYDYS